MAQNPFDVLAQLQAPRMRRDEGVVEVLAPVLGSAFHEREVIRSEHRHAQRLEQLGVPPWTVMIPQYPVPAVAIDLNFD